MLNNPKILKKSELETQEVSYCGSFTTFLLKQLIGS